MSKKTVIIILSILVICLSYSWVTNDIQFKQQLKLIKKENDSILKVKDLQIKQRDTVISEAIKENESLMAKSEKIRYVKYEKFTYVNRSIDDALDVFSNHPINTTTGAEN